MTRNLRVIRKNGGDRGENGPPELSLTKWNSTMEGFTLVFEGRFRILRCTAGERECTRAAAVLVNEMRVWRASGRKHTLCRKQWRFGRRSRG
ncbi:hypothetical protein EVAR_101918_1 [Eumeta japonica]|uniref:Uncharacterized protein n=1 Tax=Eumeta variegata TaxID=151549 RepID=A0A4C1TSA3_EUMVA|nr:hypothetical protein EVAR_101918_1 [Eumeta japonica]